MVRNKAPIATLNALTKFGEDFLFVSHFQNLAGPLRQGWSPVKPPVFDRRVAVEDRELNDGIFYFTTPRFDVS
jgi:hypothetical protein